LKKVTNRQSAINWQICILACCPLPIAHWFSRLLVACFFFITLAAKFKTMAYWLVKSEPSVYSWDQFEQDKQTFWDGVRNYAARNNLKAMKKGDEVLYYHSNEGLEIVGIAKVVKEFYQDPSTDDDKWVAVDLKPYKKLKHPVSLSAIKKDKRLANMALVRISQLSVQPVTDEEWAAVMELAKL
jgi:predicted RNA-binding protein with PUA-like domain